MAHYDRTAEREIAAMDSIIMDTVAPGANARDPNGLTATCDYIAWLVWEAVQRRVASGSHRLIVTNGRQRMVPISEDHLASDAVPILRVV